MASTWSALKIELLETGQNSGTWGTSTNVNLGDAVLGEAITGQATVDFPSDADVTITLTDSATTQAARNLRLNITESSTGVGSVRSLILGSGCQIEKFYLINNTGTGAKTVKNTSGTGITVPAGKATLVFNNGTNVVDAASYFSSLTLGSALPVASGGTGLTAGTSGGVLGYTATGTLASSVALTANALVLGAGAGATPTPMASLGTTTTVLHGNASGAPTFGAVSLTADVTGVLPTANGGTNLGGATPFTSGGVVYASSTSALATGSALTFNGTNEFKVLAATGTAYNRTESTQYSTFAQHFAASGNTGVEYKTAYRFVDTDVGELMRLTSTGLGIGTSSPTTKLYVTVSAASTACAAFFNTDTANGNGVYIKAGGANSGKYALAIDNAASSSLLLLDNAGNLGLGTSSPATKLHVSGRSRVADSSNAANYMTFGVGADAPYGNASISTTTAGLAIVAEGAGNMTFRNNGSEALRIDTANNLGLGVAPSAWRSGDKAIQVGSVASLNTDSNVTTDVGYNYFYNSSDLAIYSTTAQASRYSQYLGAHRFFTAPSGTAGNAISFTQAMTLDASGNLAIGTTTVNNANTDVLTIGKTSNSQDVALVVRQFGNNTAASFNLIANDNNGAPYNYIASSTHGGTVHWKLGGIGGFTGGLAISTSGSERARITSGGYFKASNTGTYFGSTGSYHELRSDGVAGDWTTRISNTTATAANAYGVVIEYTGSSPNGTVNEFIECRDNVGGATTRAAIRSNGGIANYSGNDVNLSDRREKTNFAPAKSYLDVICAIPVQTFNYIDQNLETDDGLTLGVVAQDVQAVAPELVMESNWGTQEEPKMRLSIYQTDLQYALMKCIQELKAEFDAYKASHP